LSLNRLCHNHLVRFLQMNLLLLFFGHYLNLFLLDYHFADCLYFNWYCSYQTKTLFILYQIFLCFLNFQNQIEILWLFYWILNYKCF
jgi:hypothetical protein